MSEQPQGPVAPADQRDSSEGNEGVHPVVINPDQPTFPAPIGVSRADLEEAGVAHAYMGLPEDDEDDEDDEDGEDGAAPASQPEGKPADPDAEAKEKALAEQAQRAQQQSGQGGQQGS